MVYVTCLEIPPRLATVSADFVAGGHLAMNSDKIAIECRICGSAHTMCLPVGQYADFFRLRVDVSRDPHRLFSREVALLKPNASFALRAIRKIARLTGLTGRGQPHEFRTSMTICVDCHAVTPAHEYSFGELSGLYRDYRSETYNRDRISVEPGYAKIAKAVGEHPLEVVNRNSAVDAFLRKNAAQFSGGHMIDYGGSDGRFLTPFMIEVFDAISIFEPSDAPLHASVVSSKVSKTASPELSCYAFLACMHVLEHVGSPRNFVIEAMRYVVPGGLAYIEVPLELTDRQHQDLNERIVDYPFVIHEHLNRFDRLSLPKLVQSVQGLELVDSTEEVVEMGWASGLIGRYLVRRAA